MSELHLDFETYSEVDLKKVGAYAYATHPSTEILCMSVRNDEASALWTPNQKPPGRLTFRDNPIWAWNALFEILIWQHVAVPKYGFPEVPLTQWRDTMALAAYFGLPLDLDRASRVVGGEKKDRRGSYLISVLCKPVKPTKARPWTRLTPENSPDLFQELYEYCDQDTAAEMAVHAFLPRQELPPREQEYWFDGIQSALRGVRVDDKAVKAMIALRDEHIEKQGAILTEMTGGLTYTQGERLREHLLIECGVPLDNMQKGTLEAALKDETLPADARKIIDIRLSCNLASVKKLDAMLRVLGPDGRAHGMQVYFGAHTGRDSGRLIQVQNFPKGSFDVSEYFLDVIGTGALTLEDFEMVFGDPLAAISTMLRGCMMASEGKWMYVADFTAIEAVILAWMTDDHELLEAFRRREKVYEKAAAGVYQIPVYDVDKAQRGLGKVQILGCGYGMGKDRFAETCEAWGVVVDRETSDRAVDMYRQEHPMVVNYWYKADDACKAAISTPNKLFRAGPVTVASNGRYLFARLPSGRTITYPMPEIRKVKKDWGWVDAITYKGVDSQTRQWHRIETWGGSMTENWDQGIARDIMKEAQLRTKALGFETLFSVHDEIVSEHERDDRYGEYRAAMIEPPAWALDLPIHADGEVCKRFRKG